MLVITTKFCHTISNLKQHLGIETDYWTKSCISAQFHRHCREETINWLEILAKTSRGSHEKSRSISWALQVGTSNAVIGIDMAYSEPRFFDHWAVGYYAPNLQKKKERLNIPEANPIKDAWHDCTNLRIHFEWNQINIVRTLFGMSCADSELWGWAKTVC